MADDEFNDFFDMSELDESPFDDDVEVGFDDDEILSEEFEDVPGDSEGVSRTFIIIAGVIALSVLAIIVLIALVALTGGDKLTDNQKTATAIVQYNATQIEGNNRTLTALAVIDAATSTAQFNAQQSATAEFVQARTQQAVNAQQTATAAAYQAATLTLEAQLAQTQAALDASATAVIMAARELVVTLMTEDNIALDNVRVRLYADDGDGEFDPEDRQVTTTGGDTGGSTGGATSAPVSTSGMLAYGEVGEGTLNLGETAEWSFAGSTGDVVSISAEAADPTQMDTFLELFGPTATRLIGDDDSGEGSNALIAEYALPADGTYVIAISSIDGQGAYQLRLNVAIEVPGTQAEPTTAPSSYRPSTGGEDLGEGIVLARQGGETPTPTVEGGDEGGDGDTLITVLEALDGMVDFGSLEPGNYWLELEYDSLPASVQAKLPPNQPLYLMVTVPETGEVGAINFEITYSTPTPTSAVTSTSVVTVTPIVLDGTIIVGDIATLTTTPEPAASDLPDTGFFSDIGDNANNIDGTSGLTVLAIVAAGLVAVVFVARKLRTSA